MSNSNDTSAPAPSIATKAELDHRIEQRPTPAPERHHTIGGTTETAVSRQSNATNELRIDHLQNRLERARNGMELNQTFSSLHGRAKADFGRSR